MKKLVENQGQKPWRLSVLECLVLYVDHQIQRQLKSTLRGVKTIEKGQ